MPAAHAVDLYKELILAAPKAFQVMPIELIQHIALYLHDDRDLVHLRATCRDVRNAIDAEDSLWFKKFHALYDPPANIQPCSVGFKAKLREIYQKRHRHLYLCPPSFRNGTTKKEREALSIVAELINDSYRGRSWVCNDFGTGQTEKTCMNLEALKRFIGRSDITEDVFSPHPTKNVRVSLSCIPSAHRYNPALTAVQLMCAPSILKDPGNIYGFDESQMWAYATIKIAPIFGGFNKAEVNTEWVLHVLNFFRYHIGRPEENTLHGPFSRLLSSEKPILWQDILHNGPADLGAHWKGTYAYMDRDELRAIRSGNQQGRVLIDRNVDHGDASIQTMNITFPESMPFPWPGTFEHHLKSTTFSDQAPRTRAQHRSGGERAFKRFNKHFHAVGYDDEDFNAAGWLNQLPSQHGIPGWRRMTMMKYFEDGAGGWDTNALWAYEGVVLPGGQLMLGRWWSPDAPIPGREVYTGPFIFWNVDAACHDTKCDLHGKCGNP